MVGQETVELINAPTAGSERVPRYYGATLKYGWTGPGNIASKIQRYDFTCSIYYVRVTTTIRSYNELREAITVA